MAGTDDSTGGMDRLAEEAARKTDEALEQREAALLCRTAVDLAALRPQVSDKDSFDKLIAVVNDSTAKNESIAALKQRVSDLGQAVVSTAKKVAGLVQNV